MASISGIPRNSHRYRNSAPESLSFRPHPYLWHCDGRLITEISERFRNGIPGIESRRNHPEFPGIHTDSGIAGIDSISGIRRNWTEFLPIPELQESLLIAELDRIPRNSQRCWNRGKFEVISIPESVELIPGAESIPQCSTPRNRMTALKKYFLLIF